MQQFRQTIIGLGVVSLCVGQAIGQAQQAGSPAGIKAEQTLPSRYPTWLPTC